MNEPTTQSTDLNCEQCRELLSDYVDRELTEDEQKAVERHLASCTRCASESTRMVGLKNVVQHWNGIQGSEEFHEDVMGKLITESQMMPSKPFTDAAEKARAESVRQTEPAGTPSWVWLIAGVAIAAALALAAFLFFRS
jgi:anti-sigma factor RsiW